MVEFKTNEDLSPAEEKLLRIKEKEQRLRKELEEELNKRKKELKKLQEKAERELNEIKDLEKRTEREIEIEKDVKNLEDRIRDIKKIISSEEEKDESTYYNSNLNFEGINKNMDYLLNADYISKEKLLETERNLYNNIRDMQKDLGRMAQESYAFNTMIEKFKKLNARKGEDNFGYMKKIRNMLGSLEEYVRKGR